MLKIDLHEKQAKRLPARKKRPVIVERRYTQKIFISLSNDKWVKYGKYRDKATAETAISIAFRKYGHFMELRIKKNLTG